MSRALFAAVAESAAAIPPLTLDRPLVFTGTGRSLYSCEIAAAWMRVLTGGRVRPVVLDAHDLALGEPLCAVDQVVVVGDLGRGTNQFPNDVLATAHRLGADVVSVSEWGLIRSSPDPLPRDYLDHDGHEGISAHMLSLAGLGQLICRTLGAEAEFFSKALAAVPAEIERTLELPLRGHVVDRFLRAASVTVVGSGTDTSAARQAAAQLQELTGRWTEGRSTETMLHGLPTAHGSPGLVCLIQPEADDGGRHHTLSSLLPRYGTMSLTCADSRSADLPFAATSRLTRPVVAAVPFARLAAEAAQDSELFTPDFTGWSQRDRTATVPAGHRPHPYDTIR